jgi:four helix bundle protein
VIIMNANPSSAASVAPAPQSPVSRTPERARPVATTLETFDVYRVSLDACRSCASIAASLDANLRDQLRRASSSVVLNTAEGFGSVSRGVKRRHYEIARGSAMECVAILDLALALGLESDTVIARALFTRAAMMLSKLGARFR